MKPAIAAVAVAALALAACRSKPDRVIIERPSQPTTVVVEKEHSHGSNCGHYYHNGLWYAEPEHIRVVEVHR